MDQHVKPSYFSTRRTLLCVSCDKAPSYWGLTRSFLLILWFDISHKQTCRHNSHQPRDWHTYIYINNIKRGFQLYGNCLEYFGKGPFHPPIPGILEYFKLDFRDKLILPWLNWWTKWMQSALHSCRCWRYLFLVLDLINLQVLLLTISEFKLIE